MYTTRDTESAFLRLSITGELISSRYLRRCSAICLTTYNTVQRADVVTRAKHSLFVGKIDIVKTLTSLSESNTLFSKVDRRDDDMARNSRRYTYIYVLQRS